MDEPRIERRGRPAKDLSESEYMALLSALGERLTFAQACAKAGTSAHVVKRAMRRSEILDFEVRLACMIRGRKKLCDRGLDPAVLLELGREAELVDAGEPRRPWEKVRDLIGKRRDLSAALAAVHDRFELPAASAPGDEAF